MVVDLTIGCMTTERRAITAAIRHRASLSSPTLIARVAPDWVVLQDYHIASKRTVREFGE